MTYRRAEGVLDETLEGRAMRWHPTAPSSSRSTPPAPRSGTPWATWRDPSATIARRLHESGTGVELDVLEADVRSFLTELAASDLVVSE